MRHYFILLTYNSHFAKIDAINNIICNSIYKNAVVITTIVVVTRSKSTKKPTKTQMVLVGLMLKFNLFYPKFVLNGLSFSPPKYKTCVFSFDRVGGKELSCNDISESTTVISISG